MARLRWPLTTFAILLATGAVALSRLASIPLPQIAPPAQSSRVLASDGQVIATLHGEQDRTIVSLNQVSPNLRLAVVSTEDRTFFEHRGFSIRGVVRAARANWEAGRILQGGSTITQQYVRSAFPQVGRARTLSRKLKETFWAIQLERRSSKDEILERYLNAVYFGRGAYGAEAAARTYFKVPASGLTLGQAAYLAGLIRAPQRYQIDEDAQKAIALRDSVIRKMQSNGWIQPAQAYAAQQEDLRAQFKPGMSVEADSPRAGYFIEYVRRMLRSEFGLGNEEVLRGGLQIRTTLDVGMQDAAEAAIKKVLDRPGDPEAALVAMDPQGNVKAMVGGRNVDSIERARGFNFAADVTGAGGGRPAGSAFKPFALAAFVAKGKSLESIFSGASTVTIDSEQCRNGDGRPWTVSNYGGAAYGYLNVIAATTNSVNTIYAQMMGRVVAPDEFIDMAGKAGISIPAYDRGCALTLGTSDVTPLEMARAYTTFAQRGKRPKPLFVRQITRPDGSIVAERVPELVDALDPNVADTVNYVLEKNIQSGTGTGGRLGRPAAGKTGTTENFQNAWFAGYTPELTAVVWMGYPPDPQGRIPGMLNVHGRTVPGGSFPTTIWRNFMSKALEDVPGTPFNPPRLGGEIIDTRPTPPPPPELPPILISPWGGQLPFGPWSLPPCFPFCGMPGR